MCDSKIIISCGRKSVIPSIAIKKRFGKEVFNIHIQDPKVSFKNFDLIVCPEHDKLEGENVLKTKGSIHYLTKKEIADNSKYLRFNKEKKKNKSYLSLSAVQIDILITMKNKFILFLIKLKHYLHQINLR